ncbi:MAG: hypothetical protein IIB77_07730 [Proteobacteria bacterium]|nr:hypothetical protein [Pseudomonadota bacterium]
MQELKEGVVLAAIFWSEGGELTAGSGENKSITVRMQNGQMASVPWAEVIHTDGRKTLYNLALAEGVTVHDVPDS